MTHVDDPRSTFDGSNFSHLLMPTMEPQNSTRVAVWPHQLVTNVDVFNVLEGAIKHQELLPTAVTPARAYQQDVRLLDLDAILNRGPVHGGLTAFVVVIDCDRKILLRTVLPDDVLVEVGFDLAWLAEGGFLRLGRDRPLLFTSDV
jgi:hypothetical protein